MSSFTLRGTFPEGTSVGVYAVAETLPPGDPAGAPPGSAVTSGTVSSGTVTFSGLTQDAEYYAAAQVGGVWKYVRFKAGANVDPSQDGAKRSATETISGAWTFSQMPVLPDGGVTAAKVASDVATQAELDAVQTASIQHAIVDAKGDLIVGSAADTAIRKPVGTNDYGLVADSTATGGVAWKAVAGAELGYAEITSNATTTSATAADVTGLSATVTVGTRPITIEFYAWCVYNTAAASASVVITEGASVLQQGLVAINVANSGVPVLMKVRVAPSAGSHTYKIQMYRGGSGTATIAAASGSPAFIRVVEG
jgi:hypothetical protein